MPMWIEIRSRIIQSLRPYPDARDAVAHALTAIDAATTSGGEPVAKPVDPNDTDEEGAPDER
jgi:hypothetical protein